MALIRGNGIESAATQNAFAAGKSGESLELTVDMLCVGGDNSRMEATV